MLAKTEFHLLTVGRNLVFLRGDRLDAICCPTKNRSNAGDPGLGHQPANLSFYQKTGRAERW
jgi:hypothetical protein